MKKIKVAIIGTGNIGTDLLLKIQRSKSIECSLFAGRNSSSKGIEIAQNLGIKCSVDSIKAIQDEPEICDIVFDATSANTHKYHAPILKRLNKFTIDLTPSRVGAMCIPVLNLKEALNHQNINLVSCGGQAAVPISWAIMKSNPQVKYIEVVASISSRSAGSGTRANIDEYTQVTKDAISFFSGVEKSKAIIVLNPAEPPIMMHNTIYALVDKPDMVSLKEAVYEIVDKIKQYVPGYQLVLDPVWDAGRVIIMVKVKGNGDFLPEYSGNLDIITNAAVYVAEEYAKFKKNGGNL